MKTTTYSWSGIAALSICLILSGCGKQPPLVSAWRNGEFILTNTSDTPVHHVRVNVARDADGKHHEQFIVTLGAHTSKTFRWNESYSPAGGGKITVTCSGYSQGHVHKIEE